MLFESWSKQLCIIGVSAAASRILDLMQVTSAKTESVFGKKATIKIPQAVNLHLNHIAVIALRNGQAAVYLIRSLTIHIHR